MGTACVSRPSAPAQPGDRPKSDGFVANCWHIVRGAADDSRQRLFQETTVWRRLSHPNVLPVLGVTPKFFPLRVVTEWMINGNIMDFTHKHPEVNRLYLVCSVPTFYRML